MPTVSVVICTLNRGPAIAATIDSLLTQSADRNSFAIVFIDNGSTAENTAVLQAQTARAPNRIRYLREEVVGESSARNCAIRECASDILVFLDDDAIAPTDWLQQILKPFAAEEDVAVVGGRVELAYEGEVPSWIDASLTPYLSAFDPGASTERLHYPDYPRGANMAFRRDVFESAGQFSERFGRKGTCLLSYSETEMIYRVEQAGFAIAYAADAWVDHIVRTERLDRDWFRRRIYWQGRSMGLFDLVHRGRLYALRRIPGQCLGWLKKSGVHRDVHRGYLVAILRGILVAR